MTINIKVIIPFRDRGLDLRRGANLETVLAWWWAHGLEPEIVDDGLEGDAQFNRHRAYNLAVSRNPQVDVFVFTEADMILPIGCVEQAIAMAHERTGLVVPFTQYRYLSDQTTQFVRDTFQDASAQELAEWFSLSYTDPRSIFQMTPESVMEDGDSIGAVNVVSRRTLDATGGFTEATSGNWYDDNIIEEGFRFLTGSRTRWVEGPAVHLYHLPGWTGQHLTDADKAATARNRQLLIQMRADIRLRRREAVRDLMAVRA